MESDRRFFARPVEIEDSVVEGAGVGAFDPVGRGVVGRSGVGETAGGHFVKIEGKAAFGRVHFEDFGEVSVSAEEDGGAAVCRFEKLEEACFFVGHVGPLFEAVIGGEKLDGADDDAEFGGLCEFGGEPVPLFFAEHGGVGSGCLDVVLAAVDFFLLERAAEVAGVEQDELHALSGGSEDFGVVDAFGFTGRVVGGEAEDILEDLLRFAAFGVFASGVVEAVVVIVPGWENRDLFGEGGEVGLAGELAIFFPEDRHVLGIPVDVVAHEEKEVGLFFGDRFEDPFVLFRLVAGAAGDPGYRFGGGEEEGEGCEGKGQRANDHALDILREFGKARRECFAVVASLGRRS